MCNFNICHLWHLGDLQAVLLEPCEYVSVDVSALSSTHLQLPLEYPSKGARVHARDEVTLDRATDTPMVGRRQFGALPERVQ